MKIALDFARQDKHTLVIVTADHECADFDIVEQGTFTNAEAAGPPTNRDSGNVANNSTTQRTTGNSKDTTRSAGPINGSGAGNVNNFAPATFRIPTDREGVTDGSTDASLWLTYLSCNHTGADVPIFSYGRGSDELQGRVDNTDLFGVVARALGVTR